MPAHKLHTFKKHVPLKQVNSTLFNQKNALKSIRNISKIDLMINQSSIIPGAR